jgi:hypothetical protein
MTGIWYPVSTAPRDGTPVILWMAKDDGPPALPLTAGFWIFNPRAAMGYWTIFGDHPRFCSDRQIRGWKPLLRDHAADKPFPIQ